jgi:signal transduction histidine kinase
VAWLTDRIFFKNGYSSEALLFDITHIMADTIDLEKMQKKVLSAIMGAMKIERGAVLMVEGHKFSDGNAVRFGKNDFKKLDPLFYEKKLRPVYVFDELEEGKLKNSFRDCGVAVAVPVLAEGNFIAVFVFGQKMSGDIYEAQDINFLRVFAKESGIAIHNALSYKKIKEFSATLEKKVEDRTKELRAAHKREIEKAEEVARLKDEFVFIAAHELKTPVAAIRGFIDLISEETKHFPRDVKNSLDSISMASVHLNQLVTDLLEVARNEAGTIKLNMAPHYFRHILEIVLKELNSLINKNKIKIKLHLMSDGPILCDELKLKEVLFNLIGNAIKYNREGGDIHISAFRTPGNGLFIIEVNDTGYGIPHEKQNKVFQKFFRAAAPGTESILGTGLGLFVSRMLVEKMNGSIAFSSVEGRGSTFALTLHCADTRAVNKIIKNN